LRRHKGGGGGGDSGKELGPPFSANFAINNLHNFHVGKYSNDHEIATVKFIFLEETLQMKKGKKKRDQWMKFNVFVFGVHTWYHVILISVKNDI